MSLGWGPVLRGWRCLGLGGTVTVPESAEDPRNPMTDSDLISLSNDDDGSSTALSPEEKRRKLTAFSARVGVWGIIGGLGSILLAPLGVGFALNLASLGFLAAGIGAVGTSILVAKDLKRAPLPLKLATFVGFPFGACLFLFGAGQLLLPPGAFRLVSLAVPAGALLGVTLMILLLAGFFSHAFFNRETDWED